MSKQKRGKAKRKALKAHARRLEAWTPRIGFLADVDQPPRPARVEFVDTWAVGSTEADFDYDAFED